LAEFSSMAVGYFYLSGFEAIREKLHKVKQLRLVIGSRTNAATIEQLIKGHHSTQYIKKKVKQQNLKNSSQKKETVEVTKYEYAKDLIYMEQNEDNQVGLSALWELIRDKRIDIRVYTKGVLHSKAYIFDAMEGQMVEGLAIVGSSNLSISGLSNNTELNVKIQNTNDYYEVKKWFDNLWEDSEPFSVDLMDLVENSWVQKQATPYEVYIKTLYYLIQDRVQIKEHHIKDNSAFNFNDLYPFQRDAVNMALNKLENENTSQNGVFISDVVGLGKSYIALAIITWYWSQKRKSTLLVCPASLKQMWLNYKDQFQLNCHILSSSELFYKDDNQNYNLNDEPIYDGYELVIIDEAHNFRNPQTQKYKILAPYLQGKKVVLLTATPQNKSVWDIYHQIKLFHQSDITDLNIAPNNLKTYFANYENNSQKIAELLQNFVIRRTRNDIINNPRYNLLNISFPKRKLKTIEYQIDEAYTFRETGSIYTEIIEKLFKPTKDERYQYSIYDLTGFLKQENKAKLRYIGLSHFGDLLRGLLKMLLFKRLESSTSSFLASIGRMIKRNKYILRSIKERGMVITGRADQLELFLNTTINNNQFKVNEYPVEDFRKEDLLSSISTDIKILNEVKQIIEPVVINSDRDVKFNKFLEQVLNPHINEKILVFSEFSETVDYLYKKTTALYPTKEIEKISSLPYSKEVKRNIVRRFSPISQTNGLGLNEGEKEIQILFTTDVLSEGQNLQDAYIIVNYDFHWNPVRLIQRIGRIDRIGSKASEIKVYNFLPDNQIEKQLDLKGRVQRRINLIHQIFGSDSEILSNEEQLNEESVFSIYVDMNEDVLDSDGGISTVFDEAEKILNQLALDNQSEYERITNLEDGIRSSKNTNDAGTFAFLKAGNLTKLYFQNTTDITGAITKILKIIKSSPDEKAITNFSIKDHTNRLKPIYQQFKEEIKKRQLNYSSANITAEQRHFQERLRNAYNLFSTNQEEVKSKLNKLNTIFKKEIPDYAKTDLRFLKRQQLSDEKMFEALENLVVKAQIEKFQKNFAEMDAKSIRTICSMSFL